MSNVFDHEGTSIIERRHLLLQNDMEATFEESPVPRKFIALRPITLPAWLIALALALSSIMATSIVLTVPHTSYEPAASRMLPGLELPPRK